MAAEAINWGSVADWVSGIGSMSAVITALYLSKASQRVRLTAYAGHRVVIGNGAPEIDLFMVAATNVGSRTTVISSIGMRVGTLRRRHALVMLFDRSEFSAGLPATLNDGESARWGVEMGPNLQWVQKLCRDFVTSKRDVESLRFVLHTSNGGEQVIKPEPGLKKLLLKALAGKATA